MAELTIQNIVEAGLDADYVATAAAGDTFQNDSSGRVFVHVKNASASATTVSVSPEVSERVFPGFGEMTKSDVSVVVPANEDRFIGPFAFEAFAATPEVNYTETTDVTIAAMKV